MCLNEKLGQKRLGMRQRIGEKRPTKVKNDQILSLEEVAF
jgi:hypothetical protein